SERLARVVARALAKKPDQRFQDGDEFARELRALAADAAGPAAAVSAPAGVAGGADADRTVAFRTTPAAAGEGPAVMGADNALVPNGPGAGQPGYDAAQKDGLPGQAGQEPSREL